MLAVPASHERKIEANNLASQYDLPLFPTSHCLFPKVWLAPTKGKGLEISGTMSRKNNQILMDLTLTNKAMQQMSGFAVQFNKNRQVMQ